ncbi:MAG: MarR family transcriptional regulator [Bacteroidetes bacterium]|nr:MAG: MarR family transcriptional regulator [Bacteroidota bacterium]
MFCIIATKLILHENCCIYKHFFLPTVMTIEEELKTNNFQSVEHKTALNILFTASWLRTRTQCVFKNFGLSSEQFNVLRILRGQHPKSLCLKEITARMLEKSSNTTRIVEKLVAKQYIKRDHSTLDKRELQILISEEGLRLLAEMDEVFAIQQSHAVPNLTEEECALLNGLLDKMREANT